MPKVIWQKDGSGVWAPVQPNVRASVGWLPASFVKQKTGVSTWTTIWQRDTVAPGTPVLALAWVSGALRVTATAPADVDLTNLVVKISTSAYPVNPRANDSDYVQTLYSTTNKPWSQWDAVPSQVLVRSYPPPPLAAPKSGSTLYVTAWAEDSSFNFSGAATASLKVPVVVPPPTVVNKSAYITTTNSGSYSDTGNYWRTDNNYVYQGGADWRGLWFYGTKIRTALANANKITKMQIEIGRANTAHGVSGGANVRLVTHDLSSQPAGDPISRLTSSAFLGTLSRGQYKWFDVPSSAWPTFVSGAKLGFGLRYNDTSYTDPNYMYAYGTGTNSGRVYIEWQEG